MKKIFIISTIFLSFQAHSQGITYKAITIKDKVPDVSLGRLFNDSSHVINFQQFRGKWVILDFWNHHCTACLEGIPKMEALQNQFNGKIQVIMVTGNSAEQVEKLFTRLKKPLPQLPMLVGDKILFELFPHWVEPHHVWIDPNGNVQYISNGHNTNAEKIDAVLNGRIINIALKDDLPNLDYSRPLIRYSEIENPAKMIAYSTLLHGLDASYPGTGLHIFKDSLSGKPVGIQALNAPWLLLFTEAYSHQLFGDGLNPLLLENNNRIVLQVKDSTPFYITKDSTYLDEWADINRISYELRVPVELSDELFIRMQDDLNYLTRYNARIEKRRMKCLVLTRTSKYDKLKTKDLTQKPKENYHNYSLVIRNKPIHSSLFVNLILFNLYLSTPIIDNTQLDEPVDMDIPGNLKDIPALRKELSRYDLDLVEQVRDIDMLVIRDKIKINK